MGAMTDEKTSGSDERLSYEQARAELASVVERLEAGGTSLEESLALWERGEALAVICQRWLDGARARIDAARPDPAV
ncbi:exodeoxyribonuclease VII small subunit [Micromonospora sp. NPDC000442]|uniref:exodeoxyribonuclease VII small subunit n=1 Tax=Micromonospora sp. NPDC000442 TaxID=3364217 RepID=UPI0036A1B5EC